MYIPRLQTSLVRNGKRNLLMRCWQREKERELAMQENCFDEGIPATDVIVGGGWSTRSHKHRYSAKSGVACIIGQASIHWSAK